MMVRRSRHVSGRFRFGVAGVLATVALVAAAWQTWGGSSAVSSPVSLLEIEFGHHGPPTVTRSNADIKAGMSAEVHGLQQKAKNLRASLKPLHQLRRPGPVGSPTSAARAPTGSPSISSAAPSGSPSAAQPGARGRDTTGIFIFMMYTNVFCVLSCK